MTVTNDPTSVRHLGQSSRTLRDKSTHADGVTAASKSTEVTQTVSVYSRRLRAAPQRLDPCQPANQLSVPRAPVVTFSDAPPMVKRLDTKADQSQAPTTLESPDTKHEPIGAVNWDKKNQRNISGSAV
jgi:hypothetical protein